MAVKPTIKGWSPKSVVKVGDLVTTMNRAIREAKTEPERIALVKVLDDLLNKHGCNWGFYLLDSSDYSTRQYY